LGSPILEKKKGFLLLGFKGGSLNLNFIRVDSCGSLLFRIAWFSHLDRVV